MNDKKADPLAVTNMLIAIFLAGLGTIVSGGTLLCWGFAVFFFSHAIHVQAASTARKITVDQHAGVLGE